MKFKEYITKNQVFTTADLQRNLDSPGSISKSITRAVKSGQVEMVRRGLYVSKTGKFTAEKCDARIVVRAADPDAFLVYHSALELHGVAHSISFDIAFRSSALSKGFTYDGISYVRYPYDDVLVQSVRIGALGNVRVTTREQTLIDCMRYPSRSGGSEEVVRSLSSMPYLNLDDLSALLSGASASLVSRVGWLLDVNKEKWHVDKSLLESLRERLGSGPYRLDNQSNRSLGWSRDWKLCLPESNEEVMSWTE